MAPAEAQLLLVLVMVVPGVSVQLRRRRCACFHHVFVRWRRETRVRFYGLPSAGETERKLWGTAEAE